jgi:hypothetical protein
MIVLSYKGEETIRIGENKTYPLSLLFLPIQIEQHFFNEQILFLVS